MIRWIKFNLKKVYKKEDRDKLKEAKKQKNDTLNLKFNFRFYNK